MKFYVTIYYLKFFLEPKSHIVKLTYIMCLGKIKKVFVKLRKSFVMNETINCHNFCDS